MAVVPSRQYLFRKQLISIGSCPIHCVLLLELPVKRCEGRLHIVPYSRLSAESLVLFEASAFDEDESDIVRIPNKFWRV